MENNPIEFFDDMYDNDDCVPVNPIGSTSLSTVNDATSYSSSTNKTTTSFVLPPSSISSSATPEMDPAVLYKKMLALRAEVRSFYPMLTNSEHFFQLMAKQNSMDKNDVLNDTTLQILSAMCPTGAFLLSCNYSMFNSFISFTRL